MTQGTLFDEPTAAARVTDLSSSHLAAKSSRASGTASDHRTRCLYHLVRHPGRTSAEVANGVCLDRHAAARRLSELMDAGKIGWKVKGIVVTDRQDLNNIDQAEQRVCQICGRSCVTWWPAGEYAITEKESRSD
jgi:hypothetical protein